MQAPLASKRRSATRQAPEGSMATMVEQRVPYLSCWTKGEDRVLSHSGERPVLGKTSSSVAGVWSASSSKSSPSCASPPPPSHSSKPRRTRRNFGQGVSSSSFESPCTPGDRARANGAERFEPYQRDSVSANSRLNPP